VNKRRERERKRERERERERERKKTVFKKNIIKNYTLCV